VPPESLRVALVCPSLDYGGAERHVLKLASALKRSSLLPTVLVLDRDAANHLASGFVEAGVEVQVAPGASRASVVTWLVRMLRSRRFDVAHSFLWRADVTLALAARLAGFTHVICSERGDRLAPFYSSSAWRFRRWLDRRVTFTTARALVANSLAGAKAAARAGFPEASALVIPNWVDIEEIDASRDAARELRRTYRWGTSPIVGFVGRLSPDKGALAFVDLAAAVSARQPGAVRFVMVGDGPQRAAVNEKIARAGLGDQFTLTGAVDSPLALMQAIDVAVITSPTESLPNVLLEFMACGVPVVAPAVGGIVDVVVDGVSGRLVPPGSIDAAADACLSLLASPEERSGMGRAARDAVLGRFQADAIVGRYAHLYRDIARG
jgi:glycosyltransferase involved in cell wall biosynthesis